MNKQPDRLYMDGEDDREKYETLSQEDIFSGMTRKEQFFLAMAIGYANKTKQPLTKREGLFLAKDMQPEDEALINAIALHNTDNIGSLADKSNVFRIAEEYAHAGLKILIDKIALTPHGSLRKIFEKEIFDEKDKINKSK